MDLRTAIAKTTAYAGYFSFPLTPQEVHFWLTSSRPVSFAAITKYLKPLSSQDKRLRRSLSQTTSEKEALARKLTPFVKLIPGIIFLGVTGSVAAGNAHQDDDLDLLLITRHHRLWLLRPLFILLLSLFFTRRLPGDSRKTKNTFCPNLWLDETSLTIPVSKRNLYSAHEIIQIKPLYDVGGVYHRLLLSNSWISQHLANAYAITLQKSSSQKPYLVRKTPFFAPLNWFLFLFQYLYMFSKITTEEVTLHSAFFHKTNPFPKLKKHLDL